MILAAFGCSSSPLVKHLSQDVAGNEGICTHPTLYPDSDFPASSLIGPTQKGASSRTVLVGFMPKTTSLEILNVSFSNQSDLFQGPPAEKSAAH